MTCVKINIKLSAYRIYNSDLFSLLNYSIFSEIYQVRITLRIIFFFQHHSHEIWYFWKICFPSKNRTFYIYIPKKRSLAGISFFPIICISSGLETCKNFTTSCERLLKTFDIYLTKLNQYVKSSFISLRILKENSKIRMPWCRLEKFFHVPTEI